MKKWVTIILLAIIVICFITLGGYGGLGAAVVFVPIILIMNRKKKQVSQMTGIEFEHWCAGELVRRGFHQVKVTQASGDYGADITAVDKKGQKWVFQCKHYKKHVPNTAVQEAVAAKAHYKADRAGVMTNSQLTKKARELAWDNAVELIEGLRD